MNEQVSKIYARQHNISLTVTINETESRSCFNSITSARRQVVWRPIKRLFRVWFIEIERCDENFQKRLSGLEHGLHLCSSFSSLFWELSIVRSAHAGNSTPAAKTIGVDSLQSRITPIDGINVSLLQTPLPYVGEKVSARFRCDRSLIVTSCLFTIGIYIALTLFSLALTSLQLRGSHLSLINQRLIRYLALDGLDVGFKFISN